jgi:hypothetical protein
MYVVFPFYFSAAPLHHVACRRLPFCVWRRWKENELPDMHGFPLLTTEQFDKRGRGGEELQLRTAARLAATTALRLLCPIAVSALHEVVSQPAVCLLSRGHGGAFTRFRFGTTHAHCQG